MRVSVDTYYDWRAVRAILKVDQLPYKPLNNRLTMVSIILDNGVGFHYHLLNQQGRQLPLVFISGYTGPILEWGLYAKALVVKGHPVLIFDKQGAGKTIDHGQPLNVEWRASNKNQLIQQLGIAPAIVVAFA